jgi:hypothetical protein
LELKRKGIYIEAPEIVQVFKDLQGVADDRKPPYRFIWDLRENQYETYKDRCAHTLQVEKPFS